MAPNATRRGSGQWGGAGGAICEDHLALAGSEGRGDVRTREQPVLLLSTRRDLELFERRSVR